MRDVYPLVVFLLSLTVIILIGIGYGMNILALVTNGGESLGLMIARGIGIVAVPIGALLGWFV